MNLHIYRFYESGIIPGIPGYFHAGQEIAVDPDTMKIVSKRLIGQPQEEVPATSNEPSPPADASPEKHQEGSLDHAN